MKPFIVSLFAVLMVTSCSEDEVKPDPFPGSWSFVSPDVEVYFDVVKDGGVYNFTNRQVIHSAIPESERDNNQIVTYDKFEGGYGRIEITSRGNVYYKITLIYNRFTEDGNLAVYDVQIDVAGQPFVVLVDQTFIKAN